MKKKASDDKKVNKNVQAIQKNNLIRNGLSSSLREMTFDNLEYFGENEDFEQIDENDEANEKNVNEISLNYEQNEEYADLFDDEGLEENEQDEFKNTNYEFIYMNSRLTLSEFSLFYRWLCQKMKLNRINRNLLLSFNKTILPKDNIVPTSYYKLLKKLNKKTKVSKKCFKICSNCYGLFKNECQNQKLKKSIDALVFDFKYHLTYIIQKYWNEIQQYKGKFN